MRIAVLSGKGGTGKTLLSVNMAVVAGNSSYIDCDVEEPNGHLFFKPEKSISEEVTVKVPFVDIKTCNGCRTCVDFCKFNALAFVNNKLIIFDDICHSCGGCVLLCPEKALLERDKVIGKVEKGISEDVHVISGVLNPGEVSGVPIINQLLSEKENSDETYIIDCPPGSSCLVMESIADADYCILVAEPTLFGVHNLHMVDELVKLYDKPHGVILNKCIAGENPAKMYCQENGMNILGEIPFDYELGRLNSNSLIAARESSHYQLLFSELLKSVTKEVQREIVVNP